jgi:FlaA1/EpsC-like NDP-sugar epimerase
MEALLINAIGTENVINAATSAGVQRVVVLSTDKAAHPVNAMGHRGRQLVHTSFAWVSVAEHMTAVYQWLASPQLHSVPVDVRTD